MTRYHLTLEPEGAPGPSPDRRLAALLKHVLRAWHFRCLCAREEKPLQVLFVLDCGDGERGPEPWPWILPPTAGLSLAFGPEGEELFARVTQLFLRDKSEVVEVYLERPTDRPMTFGEAGQWRRAGFTIEVADDDPPWREI